MFCGLSQTFADHLQTPTFQIICKYLLSRSFANTHFPDYLQTPTFWIIYKHPFSRSFLDRHYETGHPILQNIYEYNTKSLPNLFFYDFLSSGHFLFIWFLMFWCTLVYTLTDYISKHKNDVLKKIKLRELYICYLLKVSNKGTVMQIEKVLINDRLGVSKAFWKFGIPATVDSL